MVSSQETLNRCWVCQRSHAKRKCPAGNSFICSICCGSKRNKDIDCPPECSYLVAAKNRWISKLQITPTQIDFWQGHFDIVHNIGFAALDAQRTRLADLKDAEVKQAMENLIKTYQTEERGIIYEYKSPNYRIQTVIDNIQNIIARHRSITPAQNLKPQSADPLMDKQFRIVPLDEIIACLKFTLELVKQSMSKTTRPDVYFDFIAHFTSNTLVDCND